MSWVNVCLRENSSNNAFAEMSEFCLIIDSNFYVKKILQTSREKSTMSLGDKRGNSIYKQTNV